MAKRNKIETDRAKLQRSKHVSPFCAIGLLTLYYCLCAVNSLQCLDHASSSRHSASSLSRRMDVSNFMRRSNQWGDDTHQPEQMLSRRTLFSMATSASALVAAWSIQSPAMADETETTVTIVPFKAAWSAVDGLNEMNVADRNRKVVGFDMNAYKAMRDDPTRTPFFEKAIQKRLSASRDSVVLDLGTGPFCLFAMIAAQMGAQKVYAIEANPEAAASARTMVAKAGYEDIITVVEGFSTEVQLPEKVDFCIAEIVGSIASEEGAYATIRDAHKFLKDPTNPNNWIPNRIQTYAAPASYTLHNLFGPPEFDWTKLNGEPVRFSCRDYGLELLSDPQLIEDIQFSDLTAASGVKVEVAKLRFAVSSERIQQNFRPLFDEFKQRSDKKSSEKYAEETSQRFSGIAMWPRLCVNDEIVINSRSYPLGGHQRSHWQTVLPVVSGRPIGPLKGGETIEVAYKFELPIDVTKPPQYSIEGQVIF